MMRVSCVAFAGWALISSGLAVAATKVASGPDLGFSVPSVDASGRVAVIERRYYVEQEFGCALLDHSDLVTLDLNANCGQDILREGLNMPGATDPSITAAGGSVAWRTPATPGDATFTTSSTDFSSRIDWHTDTVATLVDHLEISGLGDRMVYWRHVAVPDQDQIIRLDLGLPPATPAEVDTGSSLLLNDAHPITDDGTVVYSKYVVPFYRLFKRGPSDPAPVAITTPCVNDRRLAAVSRDGNWIAFTCGDILSGGTDVFVNLSKVVDNTTPSWTIDALDISRDGSKVVFVSNGDFDAGQNPDGSVEVFRVAAAGGPVQQVTDFSILSPWLAPYIRGLSANEDGKVVLYGAGLWTTLNPAPCTTWDHHSLGTWYASLDAPTPSMLPTSELVMPPFDVVAGGAPCSYDSGTNAVTCSAVVRGSNEGTRNILLQAVWHFLGTGPCSQVVTEQVVPFSVAAGQRADILVTEGVPPTCSGLPGFVRVRAISPDVTAADVASRDLAFVVP